MSDKSDLRKLSWLKIILGDTYEVKEGEREFDEELLNRCMKTGHEPNPASLCPILREMWLEDKWRPILEKMTGVKSDQDEKA